MYVPFPHPKHLDAHTTDVPTAPWSLMLNHSSKLLRLTLDEIKRIRKSLCPDSADVVGESDPIALFRNSEHLRSESRADELTTR